MPSLFDRFQRIEREAGCFSVRIQGVPIWEWIRNKVFTQIETSSTDTGTSVFGTLKSLIKDGILFSRSLFNGNPYLCQEHNLIFFGHRRTLEPDGLWWDHILDPLHEALDYEYMHFEEPMWGPRWNHRGKAKTENLRYLDFINYLSKIWKRLQQDVSLSPDEKEKLVNIEARIAAEFDTNVGVPALAKDELATRNAILPLYEKLLDRLNPEIIIGTGNFIVNKSLIEAAQNRGVPTVEFQHGGLSDKHIAYSFSDEFCVKYYPDYILTWGQFWKEYGLFPIPEDQIINVGFPYLEQRRNKYLGAGRQEKVIFLSQALIGEELSQFAVRTDAQHNNETVYKLHPAEYDSWEVEYPWLKDSRVTVIDSDQPPLYELFSQSFAQVGVFSTTIYEGLAFGLDTYLVDLPGIETMEYLSQREEIKRISPDEDLRFTDQTEEIDVEYYFKPNAINNFESALETIYHKESI